MKKIIILIVFSLFVLSCEKDNYLIPADEVPKWLKERISEDEEKIKNDPKSGLGFAAWKRYEYKNQYFFEYINMLSSFWPWWYDYDGNLYQPNDTGEFQTMRCCMRFVWKGPSYIGD